MSDLPKDDELELSLFGGGIGESAVLHIGCGSWIVVDSCINRITSRPIALDYLDELGVDVTKQLKLVVVSHWHDDHIGGASQILHQASSAHFACSSALNSEEFFSLVAANDEIKAIQQNSGVSEFAEILEILQSRATSGRSVGPHAWAQVGTKIFEDEKSGTEIYAASPSAQTITDTKGQLAQLIPNMGPIRRFSTHGPNDLSVVLLVKTSGQNLLLGGDLETGRDNLGGWRAVVASNLWPRDRSSSFKVPHHGSVNAHLDEVWNDCLHGQPWAVVTPYSRGRSPLPRVTDISRIKANTKRAYCTTTPQGRQPDRRRDGVERTLREVSQSRRAIPRRPGHVRLRLPITGSIDDTSVTLNNGAISL